MIHGTVDANCFTEAAFLSPATVTIVGQRREHRAIAAIYVVSPAMVSRRGDNVGSKRSRSKPWESSPGSAMAAQHLA